MKRFEIKGHGIEIDDRCQYYNEILITYKHMAEQSRENFLQKCSQCKNLDVLVKDAYLYGWEEIDLCLDHLMTVLVKFGIYDYSKDNIYDMYLDDYFNYTELYTECYLQPYLDIVMTKQQMEELRAQQKNGSSRWTGGGFGISGALKGAAKASVLNLASSGVRSVFAGIGTSMDNAKIRRLKNKMFEDRALLEELAVYVKKCCGNVSIVLIEILRTTGRLDGITGWDLERSTTIYKNSFYADSEKVEMLVEALRLYPYNWDIYLALFRATSRFDHQVASVAAYFGFEMELRDYFIEQVPIGEIFYSDAVMEDAVNIQAVWKNYRELSEKLQKLGLMDSIGTLRTALLEDFQFHVETEMLESALTEMKRRLHKVEGISCHSMSEVEKVFHDYGESYKASAEKAMYDYAINNKESNPVSEYVLIAEDPFSDDSAALIRMDEENLIQNTLLCFQRIIDEPKTQIVFVFTDRCLYVSTGQYKNYKTKLKNVRIAEIERIEDKYYLFIKVEGQDKIKIFLPEYKESYKLDEFINQLIQCGEHYKANREAEYAIILRWNKIDKTAFKDYDAVLTLFKQANEIQDFDDNVKTAMKKYLTEIKLAEVRRQLVDLLAENKTTSYTLENIEKEIQGCDFLCDWASKEILNEIADARYTLQLRSLDNLISSRGGFDCKLRTRSNYQFAQEIMNKTDEKSRKRNDIIAVSKFIKECDEAISHAKYYAKDRRAAFCNDIAYMIFLFVAYFIIQKAINFSCSAFWPDVKNVAPIRLTLWLLVLIIAGKSIKSVFQTIRNSFHVFGKYRKQLEDIKDYKDLFQKDVKFLSQTLLGISILVLCVGIIGICVNFFQDLRTTVDAVVTEPNSTSDMVEESEDEGYVFADSNSRYLTETEITRLSWEEKVEAFYEIPARKGAIFNDGELQDLFEQKKWYKPLVEENEFNLATLNEYENYNMQLIQRVLQGEPKSDMGSTATTTEDRNNVEYEISADYILPDSDTRFLNEGELSGLTKEELRLARNEIYARHGRKFESEDLNQYFSSQPWYNGYLTAEEFDDSVLNEYEKVNLDLIKSMENSSSAYEMPDYITGSETQLGEADVINSLYTADNGTTMEIGVYSGTGETYVNFSQNGNIIWTGTSNRYQKLDNGGLAIMFTGDNYGTGDSDSITIEWSSMENKNSPLVEHDSDTISISGKYSFSYPLFGN